MNKGRVICNRNVQEMNHICKHYFLRTSTYGTKHQASPLKNQMPKIKFGYWFVLKYPEVLNSKYWKICLFFVSKLITGSPLKQFSKIPQAYFQPISKKLRSKKFKSIRLEITNFDDFTSIIAHWLRSDSVKILLKIIIWGGWIGSVWNQVGLDSILESLEAPFSSRELQGLWTNHERPKFNSRFKIIDSAKPNLNDFNMQFSERASFLL